MPVLAGSGVSSLVQPYEAGYQAATDALVGLQGHMPCLVLFFTTDAYDQIDVVRGIRTAIRSGELIGCCTGGLVTAQGAVASGVAVLTLYADDMQVTTALATGLRQQPVQAAERVATLLEESLPPPDSVRHATALILTDGLTGALSVDEALQTVTDIFGPLCPVVGGAAGDNLAYEQTSLCVNGHVAGDAIALALIAMTAPVGIGVRHGWTPIGRQLVITRSERNIIYELDGRSPIEVYREMLAPQEISVENFRTVTRYHPIGFPRASGELLVRLPIQTYPDGSIECLGMLPENAIVHIMEGHSDSLLDAARVAAHRAVAALHGCPPAAAILINCVTRPPLLGNDTDTEIAVMRAELGMDVPIIGMYSFGEFAADQGPVAFHNKTVVVCVIGQA